MFDTWNQWTWVAIAWLQLVVAYGGYLAYLGWRRQRLLADDRAQRVLARSQGVVDGTQGALDRTPGGGRP